jgi:hypothetical protein
MPGAVAGEMRGVLRGSCMCGKVRYELRGPPRVVYYCHCGKCRKQSGSAFATNVIVLKEHLVFTAGEEAISRWNSSPGKHRYFCSGCGSPLYSHGENRKHIVSVRCGTLEAARCPRLRLHAHRANWNEIRDACPSTRSTSHENCLVFRFYSYFFKQ